MLVLVLFFAVLATKPKDSHSLSTEICYLADSILSTVSVPTNSGLFSEKLQDQEWRRKHFACKKLRLRNHLKLPPPKDEYMLGA